MADEVLQLVALVIGDVDGLVRLLIDDLLLVHSVAFVHHSVRRHHARPSNLGYATSITVPFVVLAMRHGCRGSNGLPRVAVARAISAVIGHRVEI